MAKKSVSISEYGLTVERLRELRTHLGLSIADLHGYYATNQSHLEIIAKIESWELAQDVPTFNQLKTLIEEIYRYPFIAVFAEVLPKVSLEKANFRANMPISHPKVIEFRDKLTLLQEEIKSLLQDTSAKNDEIIQNLDFIGSINYQEVPSVHLANTLRQKYYPPNNNVEKEVFLKQLITNIESAGVFVYVDESFPQKRLHGDYSFSGMAITDEIAPLIVIASNEAPARKLFTLIHELAHLYIGYSNISDGASYLSADKSDGIERYCNEVAGNFFVPSDILESYEYLDKSTLKDLAKELHVSFIMIAYRAYLMGKITQDEFGLYYTQYKEEVERKKKKNAQSPPKRNAVQRAKSAFKPKIRSLLSKALISDVTDKIEVSHIMNLKPSAVYKALDIK